MTKHTARLLCLTLLASAPAFGAGQRSPRDIIRGKPAPSQGGTFLDAQVVAKGDDGLLQILALRRTAPQASLILRGSGRTGGGLGLWHAYQAPDKSWVSNGIVHEIDATPKSPAAGLRGEGEDVWADPQLAAASDGSGRLHVVVFDGRPGGRSLYLLRGADARWRAAATEPLSEGLGDPCLVPHPESDGVLLLGLAGGAQVAAYELSLTARSGEGDLFWARDDVPGELRAGAYAVTRDDRYLYFLFQASGGAFRGAERHIASGRWLLEPQKFMRGFLDPIGGAELRSLSGFRDAGGLMQVVGLAGGGVVHIYRDEVGTWYNNGVALRVPGLRRVSGAADAAGLINVVGVTDDGRLWHGYRAENHQWRDNGHLNPD
jgi:hypothetical protein